MDTLNTTDRTLSAPPEQERFLAPRDWAAFWVSFLVAFGVYLYTMAPNLTMEDSGELIVAGDYLGVPHPPGYPIWSMLSWLCARIFAFVPFRGYANPAWGVNFVSVLFGALAAGITAMLISRTGAFLLDGLLPAGSGEPRTTGEREKESRNRAWICWASGVSGSLLFAFSHVMWSQSTIAEVYSLNAFFLAIILLLTFQWMWRPSDRVLYVAAFLFGLGLTNYQVLLLAALTLVVVIMLRDLNLFRDFVLVGVPFALFVGMLKLASTGNLPGFPKYMAHATPVSDVGYLTIAGLAIAAALILLLSGRKHVPMGVPAVAGGLLFLVATGLALRVPGAPEVQFQPDQMPPTFGWTLPALVFLVGFALMYLLNLFSRRGVIFTTAALFLATPAAILLRKGALFSLEHPTAGWFWFYVALNFILLILAVRCLPRGRTVALALLAVQAGVSFYIYMPIVSDLRNPPMNWGHPLTWEGFKHAITRGQYEKITPSNIFTRLYVEQLGVYLTDLRRQFTLLVAPLAFLPFTLWGFQRGRRRIQMFYIAFALTVAAVIFVILDKALEGTVVDRALSFTYKSLLLLVALLGVPGLGLMLVDLLKDYFERLTGLRPTNSLSERVTTLVPLLGAALVYLAWVAQLGRKFFDRQNPLVGLEPLAVLFLIFAPVLILAALAWLHARFPSFRPEADTTSQRWILATLLGFLTMSVLLIALANLKGDLQDTFIQRVKFISSHAFYAVWIGYGLLFGLLFAERLLKRIPFANVGATAVVLALPFLPIHQNWYNEGLVREMGGAEQNGHEFGWQFGHYQLRGADGIREELTPDEEPLPNPAFPPQMGPDAIFYGGTDPGRFVPTYMIYSADVREDVYLITQNALADNTYMSVMRDLYGDQIWIPSSRDNASAFGEYVEEVRSGRRAPNAALTIQDGKVSVQGVEGVMIINGILAKMIFDRNIFRHNFYVEESYVIDWMYPYLVPHGLIMQIAAQPLPGLGPTMVRDDGDFWDWYVRRLKTNWRFERDVVARKSFSKLRSAIAGLYVYRQMWREAENAFMDSLLLYPFSPEANFRLCGNVYMRTGEFDKARRFMRRFHELDPLNSRVEGFIAQINDAEWTRDRIMELQKILGEGTQDTRPALELLQLYLKIGQHGLFTRLADNLLQNRAVPPQLAFEIAELAAQHRRFAEMDRALKTILENVGPGIAAQNLLAMAQMYANAGMLRDAHHTLDLYLQKTPADFNVRIEFAAMLLALQDPNGALTQLEQAVRYGGNQARGTIGQHPRLQPLHGQARFRALMQPTLPGGLGAPQPGGEASRFPHLR